MITGLGTAAGQAPTLRFTAITSREGLSSNNVSVVLKDKYGLMWFGTEDGLDRFDGTNFNVYRHQPGNPNSLPTNEILSLYEDAQGNLWVGTGGGSVSYYDRKSDQFINYPELQSPYGLRNNVIRAITSDAAGRLWIAHFEGVNIFDPATRRVYTVQAPDKKPLKVSAMCLLRDDRNQIWAGTNEGLFQYNASGRLMHVYTHTSSDVNSLAANDVNSLARDSLGNIWIGTSNGLSRLAPGATTFVNYYHQAGNNTTLTSNFIMALAVDGNKLCIGTNDGFNVMDIPTGYVSRFTADKRNVHSLLANTVTSVLTDSRGIYWLGTVGGGVNKYDRNLNLFNYMPGNSFDPHGLMAERINAFAPANGQQVFVGTQGGGLSIFDPATRLFSHINLTSRRSDPGHTLAILSLLRRSNGQLVAGTFDHGLFFYNPNTGAYQQMLDGPGATDLNNDDVFALMEDTEGNLWVGTNGNGINVLNAGGQVMYRYTPNPVQPNDRLLPFNGYIRDMEQDTKGNIWVATHGGGLACLQAATKKWNIFNTTNGKLPVDKIRCLRQDAHGNMWAGTFGGGLCRIQIATGQVKVFTEKDGLQNSNICDIIDDTRGLLWFSNNKGISSIDPLSGAIKNYNYHNGLQRNLFLRGAGLRVPGGDIYFGGQEGFNYFNPAYFKTNTVPPQVLITQLRISNREVSPSPEGPIKEQVIVAEKIELDYKQNFALQFVALNYTAPEQNQYAYKLEGFDKDWIYAGSNNTASYTNLDPGQYRFLVRASNNDGVWSTKEASIKIIVHPPFWRTTWAYLFYFLLLGGALAYSRYRSLQRIQRKYALQTERLRADQERKEATRVRELDRLKIKFLTNLSHEFRTPISLILGPVDTLLATSPPGAVANQLQMIKRNGRRLLNLVNQLLDFRKMEEHELKLQEAPGELVSFVRDVADAFSDLSERKQITLQVESRVDTFYTSFDHDKIERILFNLLSNAFKFTPGGGQVKLFLDSADVSDEQGIKIVTIKVSDTGIGIPPEKQQLIFDRFFQDNTAATILNQGSGIGLSITREFVKLLGGDITVDSAPGQGTVFTVQLPMTTGTTPVDTEPGLPTAESEDALPADLPLQPALAEEVPASETMHYNAVEALDIPGDEANQLPLLLLVEDNDDFRFYLKENLRNQFRVIEATDGKDGWQKALARHPQLVVSDISMPVMDGIALCRKLKGDKRTAHIPVILLTALAGEENQLLGLQTGASDYITKPFNYQLLNAKIKNLLQLNDTLKTTYSRQIKVLAPEVQVETDQERLLKSIAMYIEENLTNPQLSVEELSRHVGMSRSSLYSKLLETTGQTPVEYIRTIKLEKAAVLLEKSDMNIAQVAYSVGFSTPNYFAKSFKAKYNMLPKEYALKMRGNGGK